MTEQQKQRFEEEHTEKAQKDLGASNIKLDVMDTPGAYTVGANGQTLLFGHNPDSLHLIVSTDTPSVKMPSPTRAAVAG